MKRKTFKDTWLYDCMTTATYSLWPAVILYEHLGAQDWRVLDILTEKEKTLKLKFTTDQKTCLFLASVAARTPQSALFALFSSAGDRSTVKSEFILLSNARTSNRNLWETIKIATFDKKKTLPRKLDSEVTQKGAGETKNFFPYRIKKQSVKQSQSNRVYVTL